MLTLNYDDETLCSLSIRLIDLSWFTFPQDLPVNIGLIDHFGRVGVEAVVMIACIFTSVCHGIGHVPVSTTIGDFPLLCSLSFVRLFKVSEDIFQKLLHGVRSGICGKFPSPTGLPKTFLSPARKYNSAPHEPDRNSRRWFFIASSYTAVSTDADFICWFKHTFTIEIRT